MQQKKPQEKKALGTGHWALGPGVRQPLVLLGPGGDFVRAMTEDEVRAMTPAAVREARVLSAALLYAARKLVKAVCRG